MVEKIYSIEEIKKMVSPILHKYRASKALLFGSYARNTAENSSDIDVMVIGGSSFEPTDIFCIADELYDVSKKSVDVYEEKEIDATSDFYKNILLEGVEII